MFGVGKNGMIINIGKTKLMLISSRQKRNIVKDKKLARIYDDLELQIANCEKKSGGSFWWQLNMD